MIWKYLEQNVLFPKDVHWVQQQPPNTNRPTFNRQALDCFFFFFVIEIRIAYPSDLIE